VHDVAWYCCYSILFALRLRDDDVLFCICVALSCRQYVLIFCCLHFIIMFDNFPFDMTVILLQVLLMVRFVTHSVIQCQLMTNFAYVVGRRNDISLRTHSLFWYCC